MRYVSVSFERVSNNLAQKCASILVSYADHNPVIALELGTYKILATNYVRDPGVVINDNLTFTNQSDSFKSIF